MGKRGRFFLTVTARTIAAFPPEDVECVRNFVPVVSLTFYKLQDFVLIFWSTISLTLHVTSSSIELSRITL